MSKRKKGLLSLLLVILLLGALFLVPTVWYKPWSIDHFYSRIFLQFAMKHPMMLSSMRLLEPMGLHFHSDDLDDVSIEFQLEEARWLDKQVEILHSYDRNSLEPSEQLSYDILEWFLLDAQRSNEFLFHNYPVNQMSGVHTGLPDFMLTTHQIEDERGARNYISRLGGFGDFFDQTTEGLAYREEIGIVPPRFVLDKVIDETESFANQPVKDNPLYTHFEARVSELDLEPKKQTALLQQAEAAIGDVVMPAYEKLGATLHELRWQATDDDGVWKLPNGEAFYNQTLQHHTTTSMTADQIHQLGLEEVARIQAEMRSILEAEGYEVTSVGQSMQALGEEERFRYPDTDDGRQQILDDYTTIVADADAGLDAAFNLRPKAGVEVVRIPQFREANSTTAYYDSPAFDGSRPGRFYVNLRNVDEHNRFNMRTLAYHEAIPGHHFQIALTQEMEDVPFFRRVVPFTAYEEGWALYSEIVADEAGFHPDPYSRLGYLQGQLYRAVRLVVDTGIHAKRWTREEALDYMMDNTGMPETDVVSEIERYIVNPGQACAYKVGQLHILELRQRAKERMGPLFDLKGFHDVILGNGAMPLTLLEQQVDRWIEQRMR